MKEMGIWQLKWHSLLKALFPGDSKFLISVFHMVNCICIQHYSDLKIKKNTNSIFLLPITEIEVEKVARSLKNKLTAGTDEIPEYVVKQCIEQLKVPFANIYNASLESGMFPDKLKIVKVIPIHKKGT